MLYTIAHPWRSTPTGEVTLALDVTKPSFHLVAAKTEAPTVGEPVEVERVIGDFTLHRSPDERVPEVGLVAGRVLAKAMPAWLEVRLLELLNGIGGLGRATSNARHRMAMRSASGPMDMDHPLAPLGIWGPYVGQVTGAVRKGRFKDWEEVRSRLDASLIQSMSEGMPKVLQLDMLGVRTPRMLIREPL